MSKPGKPDAPKAAALIDVNDSDQMIRLALGALFITTAIARGISADLLEIAPAMIRVADALMDAAARARDAPP